MAVLNSPKPEVSPEDDGEAVRVTIDVSNQWSDVDPRMISLQGPIVVTGRLAAGTINAIDEFVSRATVTRIVGDDLVYLTTDAGKSVVLTPDKIAGYAGQTLVELGIRKGTKLEVGVDRLSGRALHAEKVLEKSR